MRRKEANPQIEAERLRSMLIQERGLWASGCRHVAGVDEAGRGPLAGPVVAAAVIFPENRLIPHIDDSKRLSPAQREALFRQIFDAALSVSIGVVDASEIDRVNILRATWEAMRQAVEGLSIRPDHVLIDGREVPDLGFPQTALIRGDRLSFTIAAASILAKVTRDRIMVDYDGLYPGYGFVRHKGYGTPEHLEAIHRLGPCPIHRRCFHPLRMIP